MCLLGSNWKDFACVHHYYVFYTLVCWCSHFQGIRLACFLPLFERMGLEGWVLEQAALVWLLEVLTYPGVAAAVQAPGGLVVHEDTAIHVDCHSSKILLARPGCHLLMQAQMLGYCHPTP